MRLRGRIRTHFYGVRLSVERINWNSFQETALGVGLRSLGHWLGIYLRPRSEDTCMAWLESTSWPTEQTQSHSYVRWIDINNKEYKLYKILRWNKYNKEMNKKAESYIRYIQYIQTTKINIVAYTQRLKLGYYSRLQQHKNVALGLQLHSIEFDSLSWCGSDFNHIGYKMPCYRRENRAMPL